MVATPEGINVTIVILKAPAPDSGYFAYVRELPGCVTEGETLEEASSNIEDVLEAYLETLWEDWKAAQRAPAPARIPGETVKEETRRVAVVPA